MKTLVRARHQPGPLPDGDGGCFGRSALNGMCPGVHTAQWLNSLGEDEEPFGSTEFTNGQVRENYITHYLHIEGIKPSP